MSQQKENEQLTSADLSLLKAAVAYALSSEMVSELPKLRDNYGLLFNKLGRIYDMKEEYGEDPSNV